MSQLVQLKLHFGHPATADPIIIGLDYLTLYANGHDQKATADDTVNSFLTAGFIPPALGSFGKFMAAMDQQTELTEIRALIWESVPFGAWTQVSALPYRYFAADMALLTPQAHRYGGASGTVLTSGMASWVKFALESNAFGTPPVYIPHKAGVFYGPLVRENINEDGTIKAGSLNDINQAFVPIKAFDSMAENWNFYLCRFVIKGATNGYNVVKDWNASANVTLMSRRSNRR